MSRTVACRGGGVALTLLLPLLVGNIRNRMSAGHIAAGVAPGQLELLDMAAVAIRDDAETESDKERRRTAPSSPRSTARHNPASAPEHAKSPRHKAFSIDDTNALDGSSLSRRSSASARSANGNGLNQGPSSNTRDADTPLSYEPTKAAIVEVSMPIGRQAGERSSIKMKLRALKNLTAQRSYDESDEESSVFLRERLNIRRLWCDVKDPKTPQSSDFQEEVRASYGETRGMHCCWFVATWCVLSGVQCTRV